MPKPIPPETPLQIRLLELRTQFDLRVKKTGLGQNPLVRLAIKELLAKYKTPEATIAAMVRSHTDDAAANCKG